MQEGQTPSAPEGLLYRSRYAVKIGEMHQFIITFIPDSPEAIGRSLFVKVKNTENMLLRSNLLSGPYSVYAEIHPGDYDNRRRCFITADQPHYNPNIMPGQSISAELSMHTFKPRVTWVVTVSSQIVFNTTSEVNFEIIVCEEQAQLHRRYYKDFFGTFCESIDIQHMSTLDIWHEPPPLMPSESNPVHLVILTHGMYSNVTADMFYMKQRIEEMAKKTGENIVVRGFTENVCETEKGVKYLGRRLAKWIVNEATSDITHVGKLSFIAHSLGGLVQTFALAYIQHKYPHFLDNIQLENFVTMASPLLGISADNAAYVKFFLALGIVGKTGSDLGLSGSKPLLLMLPSKSTRQILRRFHRRTVYANALHDGIVPLRTAALLFLDWNGLSEVYNTLKDSGTLNPSVDAETDTAQMDSVSEIPANVENESNVPLPMASNVSADRAGLEVPTEEPQDLPTGGGFADSLRSKFSSWMTSTVSAPSTILKERRFKRYQNYQTNRDTDSGSTKGSDENYDKQEIIPKTNVIAGIGGVLMQPAPSSDFILDPNSRPDVILHDKVYRPSMIPRPKVPRSNSIIATLDASSKQRMLEEKIARRWHKGLTWRKVLVNLPPDAHNNIIVRRNFVNAYGWPVVDHMVENHFSKRCVKGEDLAQYALTPEEETSDEGVVSDEEVDRRTKRSDSIIDKYIRRTKTEPEHEDTWLDDNASIVYDGPTGLLNTIPQGVSNQVQAFKQIIFREDPKETPHPKAKASTNYGKNTNNDDSDLQDPVADDPAQIMNTYL